MHEACLLSLAERRGGERRERKGERREGGWYKDLKLLRGSCGEKGPGLM